jgi:hypothetical protein
VRAGASARPPPRLRVRRRGDRAERLAAAGLAGVETDHPDHVPEDRARLRALAAALDLAATGSSDDHGALTGDRLGAETTAPEAFERLAAAASGGDLRVPERGGEAR